MRYPHRLTVFAITAPVATPTGTQDWDTGQWSGTNNGSGSGKKILVGVECDVQEDYLFTGQEGQPIDANICYLNDPDRYIHRLDERMPVQIDWQDGTASDAEIASVRRMDGAIILRNLRKGVTEQTI